MRLTDADAEREAFMEMVYEELADDPDNLRANRIIDCFDSMATVEAVPVVHGEWIDTQPDYHHGCGKNAHVCSSCQDYYTPDYEYMNFCPHCGADMRKKE